MGFLRRLFGGKEEPYEDKHGIYLHVECENCGSRVRVRIDKQHDLNRQSGGYVWHKTIVDSKCFRPMPTVVRFDGSYEVIESEIEGGRYLTKAEYEAPRREAANAEETAEDPDSAEPSSEAT